MRWRIYALWALLIVELPILFYDRMRHTLYSVWLVVVGSPSYSFGFSLLLIVDRLQRIYWRRKANDGTPDIPPH